jgi:putative flippase GtrA
MPSPPVVRSTARPGGGLVPKMLRYAGGSAVATVSSEVTFVLLYGPLHVAPAWASVVAWLAGAVPNYWLNRSWTWRRTGRPGLRDELLPYVAIIGLTLLLATVATRWADRWLHHVDTDATLRVVLVAAVFLGVYVVMFVLRFVLLDRLFNRLHDRDADRQPTADPTKGPR